ncbi:hypothetical protein ACFWUZ_30405 [Streptomyces sp. NPDC058646]|uniref:ATP-dependent DNA ligase n=1 Tax=Streptomyces sp. NPDC058646 TaxID=3346574 RepID=UPI00365C4D5F
MTLRPPVEPVLAQAVESVPALVRDLAFEQKFDGHRALLFTPAEAGGGVLLRTRRGSLVQDRFPDLVAAAEQLPVGLVLDGELLVWDADAGQLSFQGLQRRAAARSCTVPGLAAWWPGRPTSWPSMSCKRTGGSSSPARPRVPRAPGKPVR